MDGRSGTSQVSPLKVWPRMEPGRFEDGLKDLGDIRVVDSDSGIKASSAVSAVPGV